MKRVIFSIEKEAGSNKLIYPDPEGSYSNFDLETVPGSVVCDYDGAMGLSEYVAPQVYLHVDLSGGDGQVPVGLANDGQDSVTIAAAIRTGDDPASPVVTDFAGPFRVTLRDSDGKVYEVVGVTFVAGEANVNYATTLPGSMVSLEQDDLVPQVIGGAAVEVVLVGRPTFKVFRQL